MSLVKMKEYLTYDYGEEPLQAYLNDDTHGYWLVTIPEFGSDPLAFGLNEVVRVPAHLAPDNAPDLDGFYTTTLGKHRKEGA